ncbi:MAG: hypothetical protein ACI88L_000651 [Candidatus Paceibacteria bacterium]|jgi:hypothetical protein
MESERLNHHLNKDQNLYQLSLKKKDFEDELARRTGMDRDYLLGEKNRLEDAISVKKGEIDVYDSEDGKDEDLIEMRDESVEGNIWEAAGKADDLILERKQLEKDLELIDMALAESSEEEIDEILERLFALSKILEK